MKDDTISRAAALSALNGLTKIFLNNLPPTIYKEDAIKAVKALPPAQPEREDCDTCKHGYFGSAECNNCRVRYPSHWESREGGQDGEG